MRFDVAGHGFSIDPPDDWRLLDPYGAPEIQRQIGVYLRSDARDVEAHVRGAPDRSHRKRDAEAMKELVHRQNWPAPAFDDICVTKDGLTWAAATWDANPWIVREYFVTDGTRVANIALIGKERALVATAAPLVEQLLRTIRFEREPE
ncbi:MAG: hypothetical protein ACXWUG_06990 [Polyangiales bacterium]